MKEQEQDYQNIQKTIPESSLQRLTNASQNIINYSKILDNLSNPTEVMIKSYHKNTQKNVRI
jgi:hypothetical protein